jgi:hypothetical protein
MLDVLDTEALSQVNIVDPRMIIQGLFNQNVLPLRNAEDLWDNDFRPDSGEPRRSLKLFFFSTTDVDNGCHF